MLTRLRLARPLLVALVVLSLGCRSGSPLHVATGVSTGAYTALTGFQSLENSFHDAGRISDPQHRDLNGYLATALKAGKAYNEAVLVANQNDPATRAALTQALRDLAKALGVANLQADEQARLAGALLEVYLEFTQ